MKPTSDDRLPGVHLFLLGAAALFWELVLIRWLGSCIRLVAYYSNFVLTAAFFGLGAGALLARRTRADLSRLLVPAICLALLTGVVLEGFLHYNPATGDEYVWFGSPAGLSLHRLGDRALPLWLVLAGTYTITAAVFIAFGQWLARLFVQLPPLRAYSFEIAGSLLGILAFGALSFLRTSPLVWFGLGFAAVLPLLPRRRFDLVVAGLAVAITVLAAAPLTRKFLWSPYYKIYVEPVRAVLDREQDQPVDLSRTIGYALTVNNDYHQLLLDLSPRAEEHPFLRSWRELYDAPYAEAAALPPGPILVVGAGTGNDVAAALRRTGRPVHAVEIDPTILELGRTLHFEHPYSDPRVTVTLGDARSFFETTRERYALVVFGFLDSHTLLSSFSSLRLDNFVYTRESLEQVKRLLLPGGRVYLTFATNTDFIHRRFIRMLADVFGTPPEVASKPGSYANGVVYRAPGPVASPGSPGEDIRPSTDDWPFLYLRGPGIPSHYGAFIAVIVALGLSSLLLLPRGGRRIRYPYFLLGAAFFLVETSNVVSLSLLFGSTWTVNVLVFAGILALVLLGNLTVARWPALKLGPVMGLLAASVLVAYLTPVSALLALDGLLLRALAAVVVFLGPVYFAALVFARLIAREERLDQAYGSNVLGAVVGGACEYLSLVFGFKPLLLLTLGFYLLAFALLSLGRQGSATRS